MSVAENIEKFRSILKDSSCTLVAVSKTHPADLIREAYACGLKHFGENKVQELSQKFEELPKDIHWHMIGHLQRNKVKYIAPFVYLIHSVDSLRLLKEINKQGEKIGRTLRCLLQIHIAQEESKFGFSEEEVLQLLQEDGFQEFRHVKIVGLMGMATNTEDDEKVRTEFKSLKAFFEQLKTMDLPSNMAMEELSMGMSSDYSIALEEGSTLIRVGSAIFGSRNYQQS